MRSIGRRVCAGLALAAVLLLTAGLALAASHITLVVNGRTVTTDVPPQISGGRTLVPIRFVSESLGLTVDWNPSARTVTISGNDRQIVLTVGRTEARVDGAAVTLDVPAQIVDGRTMVPVRFVAETFAATVNWDEATRTVSIDTAAAGGGSSGGGGGSGGDQTSARRVRVEVLDYRFNPGRIEVPKGTELTLEIVGIEGVHTLTIDEYDIDVMISAGETKTVTFTVTESGTFRMYCRFHPGMEGSLVVTD